MIARIILRQSCAGTVHIALLKVGRKTVYETRAWGSAFNAIADASARAAEMSLNIR